MSRRRGLTRRRQSEGTEGPEGPEGSAEARNGGASGTGHLVLAGAGRDYRGTTRWRAGRRRALLPRDRVGLGRRHEVGSDGELRAVRTRQEHGEATLDDHTHVSDAGDVS